MLAVKIMIGVLALVIADDTDAQSAGSRLLCKGQEIVGMELNTPIPGDFTILFEKEFCKGKPDNMSPELNKTWEELQKAVEAEKRKKGLPAPSVPAPAPVLPSKGQYDT